VVIKTDVQRYQVDSSKSRFNIGLGTCSRWAALLMAFGSDSGPLCACARSGDAIPDVEQAQKALFPDADAFAATPVRVRPELRAWAASRGDVVLGTSWSTRSSASMN